MREEIKEAPQKKISFHSQKAKKYKEKQFNRYLYSDYYYFYSCCYCINIYTLHYY